MAEYRHIVADAASLVPAVAERFKVGGYIVHTGHLNYAALRNLIDPNHTGMKFYSVHDLSEAEGQYEEGVGGDSIFWGV